MIRTLMTLLVVAVVVCTAYFGLRVLIPHIPEANAGVLGATIGLIAGGILHQR